MHTTSYAKYLQTLPSAGRHIVGDYDDEGIVVYQAFRPSIAESALSEQRFGGGGYLFTRMTWIKSNFLWMMYRSNWARTAGQEYILGIKINHEGFEYILKNACHSSYQEDIYLNKDTWQERLKQTNVRLQWDPDHSPRGGKLERKAIQLGMKGRTLQHFNDQAIISIQDYTPFVMEQRGYLQDYEQLQVPKERVYVLKDEALRQQLGVDLL